LVLQRVPSRPWRLIYRVDLEEWLKWLRIWFWPDLHVNIPLDTEALMFVVR
jgi:hypothetical protein